ncbi:hypothetical protein TNCV_647921 [Trichonephila clavipes]|uniref:Uncharacterized protein n=1 Tax=Trichonephila clavipes TaxID=2585209 RepID=A0A8X6SXL2_TRICX|nr:hypothetical protein TNCV_647921 [Trichonephila clavipes]
MLLVFSPLHSSLCALLPREDMKPDGKHGAMVSRRWTAPETLTVKRALYSPFIDCTPGIVIQLGGAAVPSSQCHVLVANESRVREPSTAEDLACKGGKCTLNLSTTQTSSRWCGVDAMGANSGVVLVT